MMKILAADTSTKVISIALLEGDKIKAKVHRQCSRSCGSLLIPIIKSMLDKINCNIKDIELFCIGLGPGSFTGLRVSVAGMRALSMALEKHIIGISSFDAIAMGLVLSYEFGVRSLKIETPNSQLITPNSNICVMADARQDKVYARFYRQKNNSMEAVTDFILDSLDNIINNINEPVIITGDAIEIYKKRISEIIGNNAIFAEEGLWYPQADILAKMAKNRYDKGERGDPFNLLPLYMYPKECQVKNAKL